MVCAANAQNANIQEISKTSHQIDYYSRTIVVVGTGSSTAGQKTKPEKKIWAFTEARKNCYTQAALAIGNVYANGKTIFESGRLKQNSFKLKINKFVRGIQYFNEKTEEMKDGSFFTTVKMLLKFDGRNGLSEILVNEMYDSTIDIHANSNSNNNSKVTGLVIDARGFNIQFSINPAIVTETGKKVYGVNQRNKNIASNIGVVGYTKDYQSLVKRVGKSPKIIKLKNLGLRDKSSLVISSKNFNAILNDSQFIDIFNNCKVAIWVN